MLRRLAVILVLSACACVSASTGEEVPGSRVGNKAEDFSIPVLDGQPFNLSKFAGKKAVGLVFWATWCPNCKAEIPAIKELHALYADEIEVLAVNLAIDDTLEQVIAYRNAWELGYPIAFDEDGHIGQQFKVVGTPTMLIIDIDGVIRYRGATVPDDIADHLDALLGR